MARLIAFDTLRPVPWKNGGGSTTELCVFPSDADFDTFDWRISLATIAVSGPFSRFDGIDRSLALVDGAAVSLTLGVGGVALVLGRGDAPLRFAGEAQVAAHVDGITTDFNVMTRRSRCRHVLRRVALPAPVERHGAQTLLFLADGAQAIVGDGAHSFVLQRYDALLLDGADAARWPVTGEGALLVADIDPPEK